MTIRLRNRVTFIFWIFTVVTYILLLGIISYQFLLKHISFPEVYLKTVSSTKLFSHNSLCVIISMLILLLYVIVTTYIIYRSFEKSQAPDMLFFLLFLASCFFDCARLFVPTVKYLAVFSKLSISVGNITLFARILGPLALLGTTLLSQEYFSQNTDQNCLMIIIASIFFAQIIPLNTTVILPSFCISFGYLKTLNYMAYTIFTVCLAGLFIINKKNETSQLMTVGFGLLFLGYRILIDSHTIHSTILGPVFLGTGTALYLTQVHKRYLWLD